MKDKNRCRPSFIFHLSSFISDHRLRSTFAQGLLSAVVFWAALPPLGLWPLGWIAPVGWLLLIRRQELPGRRPYVVLWLVGFLFWLAAVHWLRLPHWATSIGWVALSGYLAFYLPVFIGLTRVAVHRLRLSVIVAAPVVWTGLELARAHLLTGFTMGSLGHTQYRWTQLIQISDITGGYGVCFLVMFVAACLARIVPCDRRVPAWPLLPAVVVLAAVLAYGYRQSSAPAPHPTTKIALIQGSIDIEMKYDPEQQKHILEEYVGLSRDAVSEYGRLDLIVWPETMFPQTLYVEGPNARAPDHWIAQQPRLRKYSQEEFQSELRRLAAWSREPMIKLAGHLGTPLLLGVSTVVVADGDERPFNSATMITPDGWFEDRYDKMHRVLFGEYVPWSDEYPWLRRLTPVPSLISAGERAVSFPVAGLRIAPNICYETVLPHVIRRQVRQLAERGEEPDVLVNLTNDGWFWGSSELDMHLVCGVFRAVECRKPLLIAANTGFSAWIDSDGRIVEKGPRRQTGTILATVAAEDRRSWYLEYGDWFAGACLAGCLVLAGIGLARRRS
jgi:apolipoprotein N-acyltransferase